MVTRFLAVVAVAVAIDALLVWGLMFVADVTFGKHIDFWLAFVSIALVMAVFWARSYGKS
jgi:hypothetical protein